MSSQSGLQDFWIVYDRHYDEISALSMVDARQHAEFAPLVAALTPEMLAVQRQHGRDMLRRAVAGEWEVYIADLRQQGETYAAMGISLQGWYDLVSSFHRHLVPILVREYGADAPRLCQALDGMQRFIDRAMVVIGQAYLSRKEELVAERRLRWFVDQVTDYALLTLDTNGNVTTWNAGAERLKGWRADEIIGQHFSRFYEPDERAKTTEELEIAARDGRFEIEGWRLRKDGSRFWANVVITPLRDEAGVLRGFGKVTRDFTERRRAADELARAHRFVDSVLESIPAMVFVKQASDLTFVRLNKAGEELLGVARTELLGKSDHDLFPPAEADFFVKKDREVLQRGELVTVEEEPLHTPRGERWLHTKKIPIPGADGEAQYLLGISLDITEARQSKERLRQAHAALAELNDRLGAQNDELVRVNRAKSDFLAMMSHELRTPLNSIIGFSEVLLDQKFGALNDRQGRYIRNVNDSGRHLLNLINDLLDLSKIEAGRLEIVMHPCAPRSLAGDAVATLQPLADQKRIRVTIDPRGTAPLVVSADAARFKQALYNLLSNAIKFTPFGGNVTVTCGQAPAAGWVRTSVTDDGAGISPEDMARLFTAFTQLENAKEQGGTGLGLALTKQLVELMGGQIGVSSTVGVGSTFWIDLPLYSRGEVAAPAPVVRPDSPLALIVDDDAAAQELLVLTLQENGFRTLAVGTAEEALTEARRARPDVITLDVFLPSIDGWDLLRLLKTDAATATIPVVMVSISSDRGKAFSLGAIEHLVKPVAREALLEALARRSFTTKVQSKPIHVLTIDDDPRQLELFRAALEPRGFVVHAETNPRTGVEWAQKERIDLVLLDLVMPEMSGIEVVAALRADERTRAVPILLVTAHQLSAAERARLNGDVAAVLSKGASQIEDLVSEIERVLRAAPRT
jgi:PAS domain S-box-containing protein